MVHPVAADAYVLFRFIVKRLTRGDKCIFASWQWCNPANSAELGDFQTAVIKCSPRVKRLAINAF
jgi:hypothetical protein